MKYDMARSKSGVSLEDLHAQIADLQAQAEALRKSEFAEVIAKIKVAIEHYGITAADLGFGTTRKAAKGKFAAFEKKVRKSRGSKGKATSFKYADDQGNKWVGMGKRPDWFKAAFAAGKTPEDLLVK